MSDSLDTPEAEIVPPEEAFAAVIGDRSDYRAQAERNRQVNNF